MINQFVFSATKSIIVVTCTNSLCTAPISANIYYYVSKKPAVNPGGGGGGDTTNPTSTGGNIL